MKIRPFTAYFIAIAATSFLLKGCMEAPAQPTPSLAATQSVAAPTPTPAPSATPEPTPTESPSPSPTASPTPEVELEAYTGPFTLAETPEEAAAYRDWLAAADTTLQALRDRTPELSGDEASQAAYLKEYIAAYRDLLSEAEAIPVERIQTGVHESLVNALRDGILTAETTLSGIPQP